MSYLREFSPQVSQIVFLAQLTVLRLVTTVRVKIFKMSSPGVECHRYHKSCSQADLTVLRVITLVWTKTSKMSFISEFSVEVSQIVFSAHLTVLRLVTTVRVKTFKNLISPGVQSTSITNRVFSPFDCFTACLQLYEQKLSKSHIFVISVHKHHKSSSDVIWPFYGFLQLYELKLQKCHMSVSSVHKYHKSCSQPNWPFLRLVTLL